MVGVVLIKDLPKGQEFFHGVGGTGASSALIAPYSMISLGPQSAACSSFPDHQEKKMLSAQTLLSEPSMRNVILFDESHRASRISGLTLSRFTTSLFTISACKVGERFETTSALVKVE